MKKLVEVFKIREAPVKQNVFGYHGHGLTSSGEGESSWKNPLYNKFSKTEGQFRGVLNAACVQLLGPGWKETIDDVAGPGAADKMIAELWTKNWSDYEALEQLGFVFDSAQQGATDYVKRPIETKPVAPDTVGDDEEWYDHPRDHRPMGPDDFGPSASKQPERDQFGHKRK